MTNQESNLLQTTRFNIANHYEPPAPLLSINGIPIMTRGNISAVVGAPKSRKTFLATMLIAALFSKKLYDFSSTIGKCNVLWIDTEQAPCHASRIYTQINMLRGNHIDCEQPDLYLHLLRDFSAKDRFQIVKMMINQYCPDVIVIDGIADLIEANNDEHSATELQDFLLSTSKKNNCHILSVIHSNNGSDKARGHTGSNLMRKCETIMTVLLCNEVSKVSFSSRDIRPDDFAFSIDKYGSPIPAEMPHNRKVDNAGMFKSIISKGQSIAYYDLVDAVMSYRSTQGNPISESRAKQIITESYKKKIIKYSNNKYQIST